MKPRVGLLPLVDSSSQIGPRIKFCVHAKLLQSCPALCNLLDCSSSVYGILQARILECIAMPSSRASSWSRDRTLVLLPSALACGFFTTSATWEEPRFKSVSFCEMTVHLGKKFFRRLSHYLSILGSMNSFEYQIACENDCVCYWIIDWSVTHSFWKRGSWLIAPASYWLHLQLGNFGGSFSLSI